MNYLLPENYKPIDTCPFCKATKAYVLSSKHFSEDNSTCIIVRHCNKCDKVWKDLYKYIATKVVD